MTALSPWPVPLAVLLALGTAHLLGRRHGTPPIDDRYVSIDGLRGFLAFFVVIHHAGIWHGYLTTGIWRHPPSRLYEHLGQSSVALFFMITGFLFWRRLIDGARRPVDWVALYRSRFWRLVPLYVFAMLVLWTLVAIESDFALRVAPRQLVDELIAWMSFTALGMPTINGVVETQRMIASVVWSLPYEWAFYGILPLAGLLYRVVPRPSWLLLPGVAVLAYAAMELEAIRCAAFLGGIAAAHLVRSPAWQRLARGPAATVVALGALAVVVAKADSAYGVRALVLLSVTFVIVAGGNSFFGLLRLAAPRVLGEISYSVYLLHGLGLYILFRYVVGYEIARTLSPEAYWGTVLAFVPLFIGACWLTFTRIEAPGMARGKRGAVSPAPGRSSPTATAA